MTVHERGAVLVETVLTTGLGLTILLFAFKLGILGFLQLTADAASFVNAHGIAIGTSDALGAQHMTLTMFPQLQASDVVSTPLPAPTATYPVDYGFNGTTAEQAASGARHGGASMVQPLLQQTTVTPHGTVSYLGGALSVSGQAVEPLYLECGPHYDVAQSAAQCGSASQPTGYAVNYFTSGENTPPYYLSFNLHFKCANPQPWSSCTGGGSFDAFGVGEYLDGSNWGAASPAAFGTGTSGGQPVSTFEYIACHQRVYIALINFFSSYSTLQSLYATYGSSINAQTPTAGGVSDFRNWDEFTTSYPTPSAVDSDIREVYNWDAYVAKNTALNAATEPGSVPTTPGAGC